MKPSSFLFHVPGCRDLYDTRAHEFLYPNNWLTLDELKEMPDEYRPKTVEVIQTNGKSKEKLGRFSTLMAIMKFGD